LEPPPLLWPLLGPSLPPAKALDAKSGHNEQIHKVHPACDDGWHEDLYW
jgi:hypothetical protein